MPSIKINFRFIKYFDYYFEFFFKRLSGRGIGNPFDNGEYEVLKNIVKLKKNSLCFVDGGSHIGDHIIKFDSLCKEYGVRNYSIFAVEPFPAHLTVLKKNLKNISYKLIEKALGNKVDYIKFYFNDESLSGENSAIKHYYLSNSINVQLTTIDSIFENYNLKKIDFLKLDIEGYEYNAILGAQKTMSQGLIDYIQLEYNQTWIEGGGTIEKILNLAQTNSYKLYRIRKKDLLAIPKYHFLLDDFFYCNLLLVKDGCSLPMPQNRNAIPII